MTNISIIIFDLTVLRNSQSGFPLDEAVRECVLSPDCHSICCQHPYLSHDKNEDQFFFWKVTALVSVAHIYRRTVFAITCQPRVQFHIVCRVGTLDTILVRFLETISRGTVHA